MELGYPMVVVAPLAGLAVDVMVHVALSIFTNGRRVPLAVLGGIGAGGIATAALTAWGLAAMAAPASDAIAFALFDAAIYLALAYGYFNFVNLNMTALRIRVLLELLEAADGLAPEDLLRLYDTRELIRRRVLRLTGQRHLVEEAGRFRNRGNGLLLLARAMTAMKWIVLGHGNRTLQAALDRDAARGSSIGTGGTPMASRER